MKRLIIILAVFVGLGYSARAQFLDSIQASLNRKGSFSLMFNSRHSSITNHDAYIFALMVGVRFDRKIGLGGGINALNTLVQDSTSIEGKLHTRTLHFQYMSYYFEYLFRITKHWSLDILLMPGIGNSYYTYFSGGQQITEYSKVVVPFEPSASLEYDFNKFVGLYAQAGYRFMLINNKGISENFNSPTWAAGIAIYPLEIFAALFPRTKLAHLIEDN